MAVTGIGYVNVPRHVQSPYLPRQMSLRLRTRRGQSKVAKVPSGASPVRSPRATIF
jgi:hypothetical protein